MSNFWGPLQICPVIPIHTKSVSYLYHWICDNWIFSLPGEEESVRGKRASCFMMMSDGKIEYDYEWCFSDAEHVVHLFLERYSEYRRSDNKRGL